MLSGISDTTCTVLIGIYAFLINANSGPATNVNAFLIDSENDGNNCERDWKDYTLGVRYQETIKKSVSLFSVNSVYKHIGSTYF